MADFLAGYPAGPVPVRVQLAHETKAGPHEEPVVVICGDTAEDFCYAFTRQRVVGNTYWLPTGPGSAYEELGGVLPDHVLPARWCLDTIISDQRLHWAVRPSTSGTSVDSHGRVFQFGGSHLHGRAKTSAP